jgi:hypothetical protein
MPGYTALPQRLRDAIQVGGPSGTMHWRGTPCWHWTRATNRGGYGVTGAGHSEKWLAHRLTYTLQVGEIPDGLELDHLCRNRSCCNPSHLEPVTTLENQRRGERATKDVCIRGHEFSGRNLILKKPTQRGRRECRACANLVRREARAKARKAVAA